MKKIFRLLPVALIGLSSIPMMAGYYKNDTKGGEQLPQASKLFITRYFKDADIRSVSYDGKDKEWEVRMDNGFELTFDRGGNWTNVDAPSGKRVPKGIAPVAIENYVAANYSGYGINEIEKKKARYEMELTNGNDLYFSLQGELQNIGK